MLGADAGSVIDLRAYDLSLTIPFREIEEELVEKGVVSVVLPPQIPVDDIVLWAKLKGYLIETRPGVNSVEVILRVSSGAEVDSNLRRLDAISKKLRDPLFRVDLVLASRKSGQYVIRASTIHDIISYVDEKLGPGCKHLVLKGEETALEAEVLACLDGIIGIIASIGGKAYAGHEALNAVSAAMEGGSSLSVRVTIIDEDLVDRVRVLRR